MNTHLCYVISAWAVAGIVLLLLGVQSWRKWKKAERDA